MKKIRLVFSTLAVVALLSATSTVTHAQATRTWVSGVGDDVNPCSRTAPCKTFAGAISKTAAGGEIDVIDPGGFGAVTITKAITIDGGGTFSSILACGTNGIIVNAGASDVVVIRNLSINGCGQTTSPGINGIRFLAGAELHVENVAAFGFGTAGIDFEPSAASQLFVTDTFVRDNGGGGVLIKPGALGSAKASLIRLVADKNLFGVRAEDNSNVSIFDSVASGNQNNGFLAVSTSLAVVMNIESSLVANNAIGVAAGAGINSVGGFTTIRISNVDIFSNGNGLRVASGGSIISFSNNKNAGNAVDGAPTSTIPQQ